MVIRDFDFISMALAPLEADAPLLIDSNRVLPLSVSAQGLQAIPRWRSHHAQLRGGVELKQLAQSNALEGRESPAVTVMKEVFRVLRAKTSDRP